MRFTTILLSLALLSAVPIVSEAAKTDVVLLVNGNTITGEIKSLEFGALRYSTDSMGTVSIDWEDIVSITTKQTLQVEISDGTRYFGRLNSADNRFEIKVITLSDDVDLLTSQIVRMTPIDAEESFWERLDGSFALGFDSEKASDVTTLRTTADISYRTRQYLVGLQATVNNTNQAEDETRNRTNIRGNYQRFRDNRWFTDWFGGWERHDELGIRNQLSLTGGLNIRSDDFTGADPSTETVEGRIQVRYLHRNLDPEAKVTFTTNIFPLLEDLSQYRAESELIFRREFVEDLFFDVTLSHSYATNPPTGAEKADYTLTTSIGYSW
jgi:putative salt-induced outer membrane protein YdiY